MNSETIGEKLRKDIKKVLLASVSDDYVNEILEQRDEVTGRTFVDDVAIDVTISSDYEDEGYYNEDDIKLAIGRELIARLGA